jgi:hypothetical protein
MGPPVSEEEKGWIPKQSQEVQMKDKGRISLYKILKSHPGKNESP